MIDNVEHVEFAGDDPLTSAMLNAAQGHDLVSVITAALTVLCQSVYLQSNCNVHVACEKIEQILELAKREIMMNENTGQGKES